MLVARRLITVCGHRAISPQNSDSGPEDGPHHADVVNGRMKYAMFPVALPAPSYSVIAITRNGLPDPFTILSGAAMRTAPVGGNWSRLTRLVMPNLPWPCIVV